MNADELLPLALVAAAGAFLATMRTGTGGYRTVDWTNRGSKRNPGVFSPSGITLHYAAGTQGGDPANVVDETNKLGWSYNYLIDRDGTRYQLVPDGYGAVHTDNTRNKTSYGLAFMNIGPSDKYNAQPGWPYAPIPGSTPDWDGAYWETYTPDQIASAAELVRELGATPSWYLIGHQDVNSHKSDPGPAFPWSKFEALTGLQRGVT